MQVFVLGMHRSGTSLLSRVVHELGLFVGEPNELMPAQPCNVEGFWERLDVSELNERLLELAGGSWDCPPSLRALEGAAARPSTVAMEEAVARARSILARLDREGDWSVKDPRASLMWPFWKQLLAQPRVLVAVRDPFEVAASLVARHGCTETLGLSLWKAYNEAILRFTRADERTVVAYHVLLDDPARETQRVASALGLHASTERVAAASRVASAPLRTQRSATTARRLAEPRYASLRRVYAQLLAEAGPEASRALEVPRWPLRQSIDAATAHTRFAALERGWSTPEPQGVWSCANTASLTVGPLSAPVREAKVHVRVTLLPFLAGACTRQRVRIDHGAETLHESVLSELRLHAIDVVVAQPARATHLTLDLHLPDAASPASLGTGADLRTLAVLLTGVKLERARARKA